KNPNRFLRSGSCSHEKYNYILYAAIGTETAVYRQQSPGDKTCSFRTQKLHSAIKFFSITKTAHRRFRDYFLAALGKRTIFINQYLTVLVADKKARRNGIHTYFVAEFQGDIGS